MRIIVPPLKSQGIKTKLVPWIKSIIPKTEGRWIEPFLGTGVVAFNLASNKPILNDINPYIIQFYKDIQAKKITPGIVRKYLETEGRKLAFSNDYGYEHFRFIKDHFNKYHSSLDFLFLSRAGFNGMMRFNKKGEWNIPFCKKPNRFSKSYITKIVNQVEAVSKIIKDDWEFCNEDFSKIILMAQKGDIIYCDPPYLGRYVDYFTNWDEKDEEKLFHLLENTDAYFILSTWHHNNFRKNKMIEKYWNKFNIITRDHFYHSGGKIENRNSIVEALVFNFEINKDIKKHNHGIRKKTEQLSIFDSIEL